MASFSEVKVGFTAKDNVTKPLRNMEKAAARFGRKATKSFNDASRSASRFGSVTKGILAAGAVQRGLSGITRGIGAVTRGFIEFDQAAIGAASRFKDIGPDAADFEHQLSRIRDRAREAGATTEFTAAQSAAALDFLARAGFKSAEAFGVLDSMINLATASGEEFDRVADISSDLLGSFGLNVDDTGQKIKNLSRLNDVLVKAVNSANVTIEDLFETMKIAGPIGTAMGQSLESVTAVTAFLGGTGIKGSQAATALKNSLLNLASPSAAAAVMIKKLGIKVADSQGNMRQLNDIIADLAPQLNKMGNVKAASIMNAIFGKRAIAGAINIGKGTEAIIALQKSLENAGGTAAATAARMRQSIGNQLKTLASAATEFGFKILEAFEIQGKGAIVSLTDAIRGFDPDPIINGLNFIIGVFKNIIAIISPFKEVIGILIAGWLIYASVMKIVAAAQLIVALTNPVTAIILGLVLLSAFIINWWDEIKMGWGIMFDGITKFFFKFVNIFSTIWGGVIKGILSGISSVAGFFGQEIPGIDQAIAQIDAFQADITARAEGRTPPNQEDANNRAEVGFKGRLDIAGAPAGSTVETESVGAGAIDINLLGA